MRKASWENGLPDLERLKPFVYDIGNALYHRIGSSLGKAYSLGKGFKI
jgi:hypothetical protein